MSEPVESGSHPGTGTDLGETSPAVPPATSAGRSRRVLRGLASHRLTGWAVAAVLALAVVGLAVDVATTPGPSSAVRLPFRPIAGALRPFGGFGGGRGLSPGRAAAVGRVASVSAASFTMTSVGEQRLTVDEQPSTRYVSSTGGSATKASITPGISVIVFGSSSGTTITAQQVIVVPAGFPPAFSGPGGGFGRGSGRGFGPSEL